MSEPTLLTIDEAIAVVRDACDRYDHRGTDRHDPTRVPLPERMVIDEIDRLRKALDTISHRGCGVPGHAVAVGCGASTIAWKALNAPDESMCQSCEGRGYTLDWGPWKTARADVERGHFIGTERAEDGHGVSFGVQVKCEPCNGEGWVRAGSISLTSRTGPGGS